VTDTLSIHEAVTGGARWRWVVAQAGGHGHDGDTMARALAAAQADGARIVQQQVVAPPGALADVQSCLRWPTPWPTTWLHNHAHGRALPLGTWIWSVVGGEVQTIPDLGRMGGVTVRDANGLWCFLAGIGPGAVTPTPGEQAQATFKALGGGLAKAGFAFTDVARTWFCNDRITAWYGDFNRARWDFFREVGVGGSFLPASTGVGAGNPAAMALQAGLLAVQSHNGRVRFAEVTSPEQGPAPAYKSAFSRAVEVCMPGGSWLTVSGTAAIAPDGRSQFPGDPAAQIERTLDVVGALVAARGHGWSDAVRGVAYFRDADTAPLLTASCARRGIPPLPVVRAAMDICRDDLLFELELDTWKAATPAGSVPA
jgi:enamine deaminase RidA (YjgF/YER057c/UK114 family)